MNESNDDSRAWRELRRSLDIAFVEQRRTRRWGIFFKLLTFSYLLFVTVAIVRSTSVDPFSESPEGHLALVSVNGLIAAEADANANAVLSSFKAAVEHPGTRAVMLSINSGGGSPVQSDRIWRGIQRIRSEHPDLPVVASIADIGASGAYYIATAAEHIYADEASLVGSIGVISAGFGFEGVAEKLGIERRVITAGENKSLLDPFEPLDPEQVAHWQTVLGGTHDLFIERVKSGRGERLDPDADVFSGLIYNGRQALQLGLIDGHLSPMEYALSELDTDQVFDFTPRKHPIEELTRNLGVEISTQLRQWVSGWVY